MIITRHGGYEGRAKTASAVSARMVAHALMVADQHRRII